MQPAIEHVSDTALLVAASRALETEDPDGFVRDPFAARLAGERGMAIAKSMPGIPWFAMAMGMRSTFIDEMLEIALGDGIDTVLNIGAGLDTRPWRLDLPADLLWVEIDFPAMLDYKYSILANEKPRCRLEHISADISSSAERASVLQKADGRKALLMTEGLLMYLPADAIHSLASEASCAAGFRYWLLDVSSPELMRRAHGELMESINRVRHEAHLEGPEIRAAVENAGWIPLRGRTYITDGRRMGQHRGAKMAEAAGLRLEDLPPPPPDDGSGVWLYQAR